MLKYCEFMQSLTVMHYFCNDVTNHVDMEQGKRFVKVLSHQAISKKKT